MPRPPMLAAGKPPGPHRLDERKYRFIELLLSGIPPKEAYIGAGFHPQPHNAAQLAIRLLKNPRVQTELERRRTDMFKQVSESLQVDRETVLKALWANHERTKDDPRSIAASNKALHLIGLELGMFKERVEVSDSSEESMRQLAQSHGLDFDLLTEAARSLQAKVVN